MKNVEWSSLRETVENNWIWRSIFRHRFPKDELDRMSVMMSNFFLHILPARVHVNDIRLTYTWGLGFVSAFLFLILIITGVLLEFYYVPDVHRAYQDMQDLRHVVSFGVILRNMHRWSAHGMVAVVFLHMVRVFYTGSYKSPREFNWVLGVFLWLLTLFLSFTGYLLPWDQLAFWAITVGTSIAGYPPWLGDSTRFLLVGGNTVGQGALIRFYVLHVSVLPLLATLLIVFHLWRIRKDGGLSRPSEEEGSSSASAPALEVLPDSFRPGSSKSYALMEVVRGRSPMVGAQAPERTIPSWPHLVFRLVLLFQVVFIVVGLISYFVDAPLGFPANPAKPENPAKAPWYFLGLQELVGYSALTGGVVVPTLVVLGLLSIPYVDTSREGVGVWFTSRQGRSIAAWSFIGTLLAAPLLTWLNANWGVRSFYPEPPQALVDLVNPASILTALVIAASVWVIRITSSRRMGAICLFSCFLSGYIFYTVVGVAFRGPNWVFVWPW